MENKISADEMNCIQCSLKDFSIFKNCSENLLNEVFSHKSLNKYKKGEFLIRKNDEFEGVFCIQSGVVKVSNTGNGNKEFILWFAKSGDIIGLDSFISNENYSYSASAMDYVLACFIPTADFKAILTKDSTISIGLMKNLCEKIKIIENRITSISRKKIREQIAEILIAISIKNKNTPENTLNINYSIKDLANSIGTTKNYLYKILADLSDQKVVSIHQHQLIIKDFDMLSHIAVGDERVC